MESSITQIDYLITLQQIDGEKHKYEVKCAQIPKNIEALKGRLKSAEEAVASSKLKLKELELEHRGKESKLLSLEEGLKKLNSKLFEVKTNKEYTALLHEIDTMKNEKSGFEDSIIIILESLENQKTEIKKAEEEYIRQEAEVNKDIGVLQNELKEDQVKITELQAKKDKLSANVENHILANYEKLLLNKDYIAVVKVDNEICGGCNMKVPPQIVNEVRKKQAIVSCQYCLRIMYWESENF